MANEVPTNIESVLKLFAEAGLTPDPDHINEAYEVGLTRQRQLEAQQAEQATAKKGSAAIIEAFNRLYPKLLQALLGAGDVLITLTQTLLIAFGVPVVLIMLLIVEQQRVNHGISLFESYPALAAFSAISLVALNLILEMLRTWIEHRAGYKEPIKQKFSFYLVLQWWDYVTGKDTTPRQHSPALRFIAVQRLVTVAILALALAGSMRSVIEKAGGNWRQGLQTIFVDSTLLELATWLGGLLFAFAAVYAAQALSKYVAEKVVEIVAIMQSNADDKPERIAQAAGMAAAYYMAGKFKEAVRAQRRAAMGIASAADMPTVSANPSGTIRLNTVLNSVKHDAAPNSESVNPASEQVFNPVYKQIKQYGPTMTKAISWLQANPDHGLSIRLAAQAAGVSPTTLNNAIKELQQ